MKLLKRNQNKTKLLLYCWFVVALAWLCRMSIRMSNKGLKDLPPSASVMPLKVSGNCVCIDF